MQKKNQTLATTVVNGRTIPITDTVGRIDLDDLKREISEIGSEQTWWGILSANADRRANDAKLTLEITKAQIGREKRQSFEARGIKVTERAIEEELILDPRYQDATKLYHEAVETASIMESTKFSVVNKATNLGALAPLVAEEVRADRPAPFDEPPTGTRR